MATWSTVAEVLLTAQECELGIDVIQSGDGYQSGSGDWLVDSDRFGSMRDIILKRAVSLQRLAVCFCFSGK